MDFIIHQESLHLLQRRVASSTHDLRAHLLSIVADSASVDELRSFLSTSASDNERVFPVYANKRNGCWYRGKHAFDGEAYFKSTDGHVGQWLFSHARLNLETLRTAISAGGLSLVDSTRRGKRFPDSLTFTIPIWCGVMNTLLARGNNINSKDFWPCISIAPHIPPSMISLLVSRVHELANTVPDLLAATIVRTAATVVDVESKSLRPIVPIWISPDSDGSLDWQSGSLLGCDSTSVMTPVWANSDLADVVMDALCAGRDALAALPFIPFLLLSCSGARQGDYVNTTGISSSNNDNSDEVVELDSHVTRNSWRYIQGAGDDEEAWSHGLTPYLFWNNIQYILGTSSEESLLCAVQEPPEELEQRVKALLQNSFGEETHCNSNSSNTEVENISNNNKHLFREYILCGSFISICVFDDGHLTAAPAASVKDKNVQVVLINAQDVPSECDKSQIQYLHLSSNKTNKTKLQIEWGQTISMLHLLPATGEDAPFVICCSEKDQHLAGAVALAMLIITRCELVGHVEMNETQRLFCPFSKLEQNKLKEYSRTLLGAMQSIWVDCIVPKWVLSVIFVALEQSKTYALLKVNE